MRSLHILFCLSFAMLFFACQKEYENEVPADNEVRPYFESFLQAAKERGRNFNSNDISFYFADIKNQDFGGLCYGNGKIVLDKNNWESSNETYREWLVFHELGHCLLGRNHRNESTNEGACLSLMKGQENGFFCFENLHSAYWRKYYFDELFDNSTTLPDWYRLDQQYTKSYTDSSKLFYVKDYPADDYKNTLDLNTLDNGVIEVVLKDWKTDQQTAVLLSVNFNGFRFICAPLSETGRLRLENEEGQELFMNNAIAFKESIKLSIRKKGELFQFFIDESFFHAMEINSFNQDVLGVSYNSRPDAEKAKMDIEVFRFD